jgi:hypothetical protein
MSIVTNFSSTGCCATRWKAKDAVLREIGAPILIQPIEETLATLCEELEQKFVLVNQRIESGANRHIKLRGAGEKRRWTLVYPSDEEPINSPFFGGTAGRRDR